MEWDFLVPNLAVRDVPTAQAWYRDTLGLEINWIWEDNFGSVGSDRVELFLYESQQARPSICSLFVDDVLAVHERARDRGGELESELELKPWGVREFSIRDPDGNVLRIGQNEGEAEAEKFTVLSEAE